MAAAIAAPPRARFAIFSGTLAGGETAPLPAAWRDRSLLTYLLDAPNNRALRMSFNLRP